MMIITMTMKGSLSGLLLLLLLFLSSLASGSGSVVRKSYHFNSRPMTWSEAQSNCRARYSDLATIYTQSDADGLALNHYDAWIGLHAPDNYSYSYLSTWNRFYWVWSNGGYVYSFVDQAWADKEPGSKDRCALINSNKKIYGQECKAYHLFFCHEVNGGNYNYHFIAMGKNWSEALRYCRENYNDLAGFKRSSDLDDTVTEQDFPVWIGLHTDGETWKWSTGDSEYRKWDSGEPRDDNCVAISSKDRKMATRSCSLRFPFVCIRENLLLVKENKTWEEALEHCRALRTSYYPYYSYDLVSVQPADHHIVMTKVVGAETEKVWTSLRFLADEWLWVNGANPLPPDLPDCPVKGQHCGAINTNGTGDLETLDCEERWNFLCYAAY